MRKTILFLILSLMLLITGCGKTADVSNETVEDTAQEEDVQDLDNKNTASKTIDGKVKLYPTYNPDYKTCGNEIFEFWFDIPNSWFVEDNSEDGYTYTITSEDKSILIEMGGRFTNKSEDDFYASLAGKDGTIEDFTFRDECCGKKISISQSKICYVRADGDSFIVFYVNAGSNDKWIEQNKETLDYIANSIRTTQESFGHELDEDSSITLDDMKLGKIRIGMNYDELKNVMGEEPVTEDIDELSGTDSKRLSFSDETEILLVDNTVYTVNVISDKYETPRGLKVGDSVQKLEELYGKADNVNEEDGIWGYTYKGYELLTVVIEDDKVTQIQIDSLM